MDKDQAIKLATQLAKQSGEHRHVLLSSGRYIVAGKPKADSIFETVCKVTPRGTILYPTFNLSGRRVFVTVPA